MRKTILFVLVIIITFVAGVMVSPHLMPRDKSEKPGKKRKVLYWVAPMNPNYKRDKPGKSPMGMDLVPVYENSDVEESSENDSSIKISSAVINNLGVVTEEVIGERLERHIETIGHVQADEDKIISVNTYTDGWVRNLRINAVGETVKKGQILFDLYSPTLIQAEQEYILALEHQKSSLIESGEKKLITLGLTKEQIGLLKKTRKAEQNSHIFAKASGVVSKLNIREGMFVKPNIPLLLIEDLNFVWVHVSIYEKEANWVKKGQIAVATFPAIPGVQWQGEVVYVYPTLDKLTHTISARLKFPNPDLLLKPNMYAAISIYIPNNQASLTVPRSSIIPKGAERYVILSLGNGRFKSQKVTLGNESGKKVSVLSGLNEGDLVVTSGQFLIDSESNLNASFNRLSPKSTKTPMLHKHNVTHKKTHKDLFQKGKILSINHREHRIVITLGHEAIPSLKMPKMVMEVHVKQDVDLTPYKVGDEIYFLMKRASDNQYEVTKIKSSVTGN